LTQKRPKNQKIGYKGRQKCLRASGGMRMLWLARMTARVGVASMRVAIIKSTYVMKKQRKYRMQNISSRG
jgi:hypothetical protein